MSTIHETDPHVEVDAEVRRLAGRRFGRMSARVGRGGPDVDPTVLPPGPSWPALAQTVGLIRFRHRFVPWLQRRYGDTFTVRLVPGGRPVVIFTRPEHIREIFAGDPEHFHAGKANAILGPIMGAHSLLLQDGMEHKRARKLLMPAFNGAALRGYEELVADVTRRELAGWRRGEQFGSLARMNRLTLEVILQVVFGVTDEHRLALMRPRVTRTVEVSPLVLFGWGVPGLQKVGVWRRTVDNSMELDQLIHAEVRERRRAPDLATRGDVLSQMIVAGADSGEEPLTDEELRDQLITLLLAGHETTASSLAWALHELGRDAAQLARARRAAAEGDDVWLEAVMKESMRLHPVIPMVNRTLMRPATIGGLDLPAGVTVGPSILLSHASAEQHPRPEQFDPARFVGRSPPANTWIPFGGGVRRCIGAGFSLMEGTVVLREVLTRFEPVAVGPEEPTVRNVTSVPRRGARVRLA